MIDPVQKVTAFPTPDHWDQRADEGLTFHFYWAPLSPTPDLVENQDTWLDFALPLLTLDGP